jgi:hypothetical protein
VFTPVFYVLVRAIGSLVTSGARGRG